jgi:hypothetical protein
MEPREAVDHLATIRRIMESATQYTVLPGRAAICGGILALAGCAVTYGMMGSADFGALAMMTSAQRGTLFILWITIAVAAIAQDVAWTVARARRRGVNPWSRLAQLAAYAMAPGVLTGCALTIALARRGDFALLPGVWMMLYGGAVWMAGVLSVRAPKALGAAFFVAGVLTVFWLAPAALVILALTFGLGHIIFGIYLMARFGD